jgi:hypothetical protein
MLITRFYHVVLLIGLLHAPHVLARIGYRLIQTPVTLGNYKPAQTQYAIISPQGNFFGQIDSLGNARIWSLQRPEFPYVELMADSAKGQIFIDISFSPDENHIIFDSSENNTGLATRGRIIVVSTANLQKQEFNTFIWGGTKKSKFAFSSTKLLAYVPAGAGNEIEIVDLVTKKQRKIIEHNFASIVSLSFDPTAKKIAIKDMTAKTIRIRDTDSGVLLKELDLQFPMPDDEFSPDQTLFYWGQGNMLAVNSNVNEFAVGFDAQTGKGQFPFMWFSPLAMFTSNDTKILAVADENFSLNIQKVNDPMLYVIEPFGFFNFVVAGAFSPSDKLFAVGSVQGQVAVYDASLNFQGGGTLTNNEEIQQIVFAHEQRFLSLSINNILTRWDLR